MSHVYTAVFKRENMRCTAQQRAATTALLASVAILAASTVITTTTAQSQDCELYDSPYEAGNWEATAVAVESYYGCADDGGFLVAAEATRDTSPGLNSISWT